MGSILWTGSYLIFYIAYSAPADMLFGPIFGIIGIIICYVALVWVVRSKNKNVKKHKEIIYGPPHIAREKLGDR